MPLADGTLGDYFTGESVPARTAQEQAAFRQVSAVSMTAQQSRGLLMNMDPNAPWSSRAEFVKIMAAFVKVHEATLKRSTGKTTVHASIIAACQPERIEWMLNGGRYRATLAEHANNLLPAGTTANERAHKEMNSCFRPVTLVTKGRLDRMMEMFHIRSMRRHLTAIESETTRLQSARHRNRYVGAESFFTDETWAEQQASTVQHREAAQRNPAHKRPRPARTADATAVWTALRAKVVNTHIFIIFFSKFT